MSIRIPRSPAAVWRAIKAFDTQDAMAAAIGVTQQTVCAWARGDRPVPAERCPDIEVKTREQAKRRGDPKLIVTCEDLRPDVNWQAIRTLGAVA